MQEYDWKNSWTSTKGLHIESWINNCCHIKRQKEEMIELMKMRQLSVLGLVETRMNGCGDRSIYGVDRLIYSREDS